MNTTNETPIHKAAAFFRSLDPEAAVTMLSRLSSEEASRLRAAIRELGDADVDSDSTSEREEQDSHSDSYAEPERNSAPSHAERSGVELVLSDLANRPPSQATNVQAKPAHESFSLHTDEDPWIHSLSEAEPETIAHFLEREQPAAVALVLSHLPSNVSGAVLGQFEEERRAAVLLQLSRSGDADPAAVRVIATELSNWIQQHRHEQKRKAERLNKVQSILEALPQSERGSLIEQLGEADDELGSMLGAQHPLGDDDSTTSVQGEIEQAEEEPTIAPPLEPREVIVERLHRIDASKLLAAARTLPARTALLALAELPSDKLAAISKLLPRSAVKDLKRRLISIAPVRLIDLEKSLRSLDAAVRHTFAPSSLDTQG